LGGGFTYAWNSYSAILITYPSHRNNCCIYPGNSEADVVFEHGLDDGANMAKSGAAQPNYYECIGNGGTQSTYGRNGGTYCSGVAVLFLKKLNDIHAIIP
jgi:hypothetical protein